MKRVFFVSIAVLALSCILPLTSTAGTPGEHRGISVYFDAGDGGGVSGDVRLYDRTTALVIGIDRYRDLPAEDQLQYAVRDAQGVARVLREKYGFDKIVELYDENAVKSRIMKILLGDLSNTGEQDAVLIYFAGHGITRSTNQGELGYLVPHDGSLRHDEMYNNISMQQIKFDVCPLIPAKHVLIVADACFGGLLLTRAGSMEPARTMSYLREITGEQVRQIITAGGKDQTVLDGGPGGHSVFTGRLIEALESAESFVTAKELGLSLRQTVHGEAAARGHDQMPQVGEIYGSGDFVFVPDASKRKQKAEDEVLRLERELDSLETLKEKAGKRREEAEIRELERQRLEKEVELKNARLREDAAGNEAVLKQAAEKAATENKALQEQREAESQRQLASLKLQAENIRKELGSPAQALGMEEAAEEIRRINSLIAKMDSDFYGSLQAQLGPVREHYATRLAEVKNVAPREEMFETEADYRTRLERSRKDAEAVRAEQSAKEQTIRGNVFAMLEKEKADLLKQRNELMKTEYKLGPERIEFKLLEYFPDNEVFNVELNFDKKILYGTCPIPKAKAKLFYENPELLLPTVVIKLSENAETLIHQAKLSGPENASFSISNLSKWKVVERDGYFTKLENGVVLDKKTGLMWAAKDNGQNITWHDAKKYCESYRGGGFTDWRMPTQKELLTLYDGNASNRDTACGYSVKTATDLIQTTCSWFWASDVKDSGSSVGRVSLSGGNDNFGPPSDSLNARFLPVRRGN